MRILVIEDHALVRDGLRASLQGVAEGVEVVCVDSVDTAFEALRERDADLITLDLMLPGMRGQSALPGLRRRYPSIPVLVLSALEDADTICSVIEAGASGFVSKAAPVDELIAAIKRVLDGEVYLSQAHQPMVERIRSGRNAGSSLARKHALTTAQARVLDVLAEGGSNRQIAELLGLSEGTVKIHVSAILKALGVTSRAEAVLVANRKRR
jgi:DNA-binding NarL/FixJ family response regulator